MSACRGGVSRLIRSGVVCRNVVNGNTLNCSRSVMNYQAVRCLSSDDNKKKMSFQETLNKMKQDSGVVDETVGHNSTDETTKSSPDVSSSVDANCTKDASEESTESNHTNDEMKEESDSKSTDSVPSSFSWGKFASSISYMASSAVNSIKDAVKEQPVIEVEKSYLRRKINTAVTFTRVSEDEEAGDGYTGPTAMVMVKDPLSAWESMRARLSSSPLIKDLLKRSFKISQAAGETTVGKKVGAVGQVVQDKMDVCYKQ